jgi:glutathione peroxidase-family protein
VFDASFDLSEQDIDGNDVSLSKYKGKVLLIVNVASRWYVYAFLDAL